jgi:hypothetical protein
MHIWFLVCAGVAVTAVASFSAPPRVCKYNTGGAPARRLGSGTPAGDMATITDSRLPKLHDIYLWAFPGKLEV